MEVSTLVPEIVKLPRGYDTTLVEFVNNIEKLDLEGLTIEKSRIEELLEIAEGEKKKILKMSNQIVRRNIERLKIAA